jgi:N-acyl-D-amino-acid deacylase
VIGQNNKRGRVDVFDLILHGGTVIDGSGAPSRRADVGIIQGRITAVDSLSESSAGRRIDVSNRVVAPGFIDVHNHSDGWLLKLPHLVAKTSQGFTTEIIASDGISYAPLMPELAADWLFYLRPLDGLRISDYDGWRSLGEYLARIDRRNVQNAATLIPFANLRVLACGWGRAPADDTQLNHMRRLAEEGMEQGAVGLSTGLDYVAQCFSTTDEIARVTAAIAPKGVYVTHVRYKSGTLRGIQEAVAIGRHARVPVHISHLKATTEAETDEILSYIDNVAVREVEFTFDIYPYLPGSSLLAMLLPYEVWEGGPLAAPARLRERPVRDRLEALLVAGHYDLERITIAWTASRDNAHWHGRSLADYVSASGKSVADAICELLLDEHFAVTMVVDAGNDRLVEPFLKHPKQMTASDGIYFADGLIHPRVYGTATRTLGPLVRDRRLFSLEVAVYKLSGFPAKRFGLADRGLICEGAVADLVVFDPETVADCATFDEPHQNSVGIDYTLVGGEVVLDHGVPQEFADGAYPGRALQRAD